MSDPINHMREQLWLGHFCELCDYTNPTFISPTEYVAIHRLLFTHAIIHARVFDECFIIQRWCYTSYAAALKALAAWDGTGEPDGWHYHPPSGRRVATPEAEVLGYV